MTAKTTVATNIIMRMPIEPAILVEGLYKNQTDTVTETPGLSYLYSEEISGHGRKPTKLQTKRLAYLNTTLT